MKKIWEVIRDKILPWIFAIIVLSILAAISFGGWIFREKLKKWIWFGDTISTVYAAEEVPVKEEHRLVNGPDIFNVQAIVSEIPVEKVNHLHLGPDIYNVADMIEYAKHVGKVPEPDPADADLDFWLEVTSPPTGEELEEEARLGEWEMLSQLVQAEAGNQDLTGMRLVVDVVLNRVDSPKFPNTIPEVIYDMGEFEVVRNGMFDDAAWEISDRAFRAVQLEIEEGRLDSGILYFSTYPANGHGFWKHGAHWFSY